MNKVLVIRLSAMGDIVLATPFLRMFKNTFPEYSVDFLIKEKYTDILRYNKNIHTILTLKVDNFWELITEIRQRKYDMVIDLQMSIRSWSISVLSGNYRRKTYGTRRFKRFMLINFNKDIYHGIKPVPLRFLEAVEDLGVRDDGRGADFPFSRHEQRKVKDRLIDDGIKNTKSLIVLAPGAGRETKKWPVEKYVELSKFFIESGYNVVTIGDKNDFWICDKIIKKSDGARNYAGELTLQHVASLLSLAQLLITNDTGVMHIGTAVCKNVIAIFGPTTEVLGFFPFRGNARVIEKNINCRPCSYHGTHTCPQKHFKCMRDISVEEVIEETKIILKRY
ncbi:MAG: lipopolysaccharide heptosyltransferase II [bacterium]